ncbi:hypothetical protein L198_02412 [Cryptococcus wingfieldii CBS 7118]|uniref:Thioredoxin domain-containing protein n=1 Tax=Cryptococcus wingfieldii CBS 7118 TaxID=1295528 RepID=A0A1E3JRS2_9TREE|nr:hypothetical protein L198_02412 [Cryptococcus wingfieldii CBS 7118]ODO03564.1 hypothetical protein L198_02412 [Cryptococcus wingfieldii CBS 7118]
MTHQTTRSLPHVLGALNGPTAPPTHYLVFYSDVVNGRMWCPDCVAVESTVKDAFDGPEKPNAAVYWVGKIQEWRTANNKALVDWNVNTIPTIVRFDNGKETARLVKDEILDKSKLQAFLK